MRWKLFAEFCLTIVLIYIIAGDLFLPQPYRSNSQQIKINLNHFVIGLLERRTNIIPNTKTNFNG
ncbi:MAG: hypothetical protein AAGE84_03400 [Cyanobacteria bacterium P01_G01_bin.39]